MRVLHVLSHLAPEAERAVSDLIAQQRERGYIVTLAERHDPSVAHLLSREGDRVDIVHAHGVDLAASLLATETTTTDRLPLVVTAHEWLRDGSASDMAAYREVLLRAPCVTMPSGLGVVLTSASGVSLDNARVIPYPVYPATPPTGTDQELDRELTAWRTRGGDVFCAVGHDARDGHDDEAEAGSFLATVAEALACVTRPDALLCVLAGTLTREACARALEARGLDGRVRLSAAPVSARAIAARCDYLALPGFDERRPFALAETWCDGVAVLAGRNARFADLDARGHGTVFFDARDPMDLARAIATVRGTTPASRRLLIERARVQYRRCFAPDAVFAAYEAAYVGVRGRRRAGAA